MTFPIAFAQKSTGYDILASMINFVGNAGIVATHVGGAAIITMCALKALGYAAVISKAVFVASALTALIGAVAAISAIAANRFMVAQKPTYM